MPEEKNTLINKYYLIQKFHGTEEIPLMRVSLSGTHFTAESTEAMQIKCLAQ